MFKLRQAHIEFLDLVKKECGTVSQVSRQQVVNIVEKNSLSMPWWLLNDHRFRADRGLYNLPASDGSVTGATMNTTPTTPRVSRKTASAVLPTIPVMSQPIQTTTDITPVASLTSVDMASGMTVVQENLVPEKAPGYVKFGHFEDLLSIIVSKKFYPVYVTGLSGNGKTFMCEQICAQAKRELIRVNITAETDEDDLLGGFRLIDGQTVWHNGPVVMAMERGAVLLLDEVDLGTTKLMCLQPVLEGKPIFLKKINKVIRPHLGFSVVATANTKGKGSEDGRFIGTNVQNEAFLERFSITMEQEYPPLSVEKKILRNVMHSNGFENENFVECLVRWADVVRRSFADNATTEIISTRRLVHICEAYSIFSQDKIKAITLCLNRFDDDTKESFLSLYTKVDAEVNPAPVENGPVGTDAVDSNAWKVSLTDVGLDKIAVIKTLQNALPEIMTLSQGKSIVESPMPQELYTFDVKDEATKCGDKLINAGAKITIEGFVKPKDEDQLASLGLKIEIDKDGKKYVDMNGTKVDVSELDQGMLKTLAEALNTK